MGDTANVYIIQIDEHRLGIVRLDVSFLPAFCIPSITDDCYDADDAHVAHDAQ